MQYTNTETHLISEIGFTTRKPLRHVLQALQDCLPLNMAYEVYEESDQDTSLDFDNRGSTKTWIVRVRYVRNQPFEGISPRAEDYLQLLIKELI